MENSKKVEPMNAITSSLCKYLPNEIVIEILSRLPVKDLIRFTSVCKSWYSLIKNPIFINTHLERSISYTNTDNNNNGCLFLVETSSTSKASPLECSLLWENTLFLRQKFNFPFNRRSNYLKMVNSVNGVFCLTDTYLQQNVYLCNPSIRKFKAICVPCLTDSMILSEGVYTLFGFGYHQGTNDYKVVRIRYFLDEDLKLLGKVPPQSEVYCLSTGSWKIGPTILCKANTLAVTLNGAIHWLACRGENWDFDLIVSFDLGDEVFRETMLPAHLLAKSLLVFEGSLSVFVDVPKDGDYEETGYYEIWVMKEYGVTKSWTKLFAIVTQGLVRNALGFTKGGKLILEMEDDMLISWDHKVGSVRSLWEIEENCFDIDTAFLESLVLL